MEFETPYTLPALFAETVSRFGERNALAMTGSTPLTYLQAEARINDLIGLLEAIQITPGDKVAILSANLPNWPIAYYAITFMGAVAVPLLPDFSTIEIAAFLEHSGVKAIFVSEGLASKLPKEAETGLITIRIEDFTISGPPEMTAVSNSSPSDYRKYKVAENDMAAIIYTSGTTGKPKGVMLSHKNITFTADKSGKIQEILPTDRFLSVLPLSHTYENTIGMVLPMIRGACVYFLGKAPTPSLLLPALKEVRPTIMLTVPLIIEKIYRNQVRKKFTSNRFFRMLYRTGFIRKKLHFLAGKKLKETFGGELHFFGIGGAKLNKTVEQFLINAKFPYAIGYGLTESSPLLAGFNPSKFRLQSTGPAMEGVTLKINNPDKHTGEGEIWAKGPNIMLGYFKDPELTSEVITPDGWLKTGDLGILDKDNYLFIRGRSKNVIVMSSGENVYPEEIESVINNFAHVLDSVVLEQKGKLVALVHFNREEIEEAYRHLRHEVSDYVDNKIEELRKELQHYVNARVNKSSQVQLIVAQLVPFQKTATQKIKRFLYT